MERDKIKGIIEAELFSSGRPITLKEIEMNLEIEREQLQEIILEMQEEYKSKSRGIEIVKINDGYTLSSKLEYREFIYPIIDKRVKPNLSRSST